MGNFSKTKSAILAKLYNASGDISKRWFVYYSIIDPLTGKLKRIKVYDGFADCETLKANLENAKKLITSINRKLKAGRDPSQKGAVFSHSDPTISLPVIAEKSTKDLKPTLINPIEYCLNKNLEEQRGLLRKKSFQSYQSQLRVLYKWLKINDLSSLQISDFTSEHARSFLNYLSSDLGRHNTTRNSYKTNLKSIFAKLKIQSEICLNPFEDIEAV